MLNILIIDDDCDIRYALGMILRKIGVQVAEASSGTAALGMLAQHSFDAAFCDLKLPESSPGDEILQSIRAQYPKVKVVMMSCSMEPDVRANLEKLGASVCLQKPFFKDACVDTLSQLFPAALEVTE